MIVGKTYYIKSCEENNHYVETLPFGSDGKVHATWIENGEEQGNVLSYSIDGATMIITTSRGTFTFSDVEQYNDYIAFDEGTDGKFYTSKDAAQSNLDSDCSN